MSTHKPDDQTLNSKENYPSSQLPKTSLKIPMPPVKQYNFQNSKFGGGFAGRDYTGDVTNKYTDTKLNETVEEIKELIDQLSKNNPINNTSDAMKIAVQVVEQIETDINLKQKAIAVSQKGLLEGLKTNPVGAFVVGAIEGWKVQES